MLSSKEGLDVETSGKTAPPGLGLPSADVSVTSVSAIERASTDYAAGRYEAVVRLLEPLQQFVGSDASAGGGDGEDLTRAGTRALVLLARAASRTGLRELASQTAVRAAQLVDSMRRSGGALPGVELSEAGIAYFLAGRQDEAADLLRAAIAQGDADPETHLVSALVEAGQGHDEKAVEVLSRITAPTVSDDFERRRLEALAAACRRLGRTEDAANALLELAHLFYRAERYDEVLPVLEQALELNPRDARALALKGEVLRLLNDPDRYPAAVSALEAAIAADPDYAWAYASYGEALNLTGRAEEAVAALARANTLAPGVAQWHYRHGELLRLLNRYGEALASFDLALSIDATDPMTHARRGDALRLLDRHEEALAALETALTLRPDDPWALARRGEVLRAMGRTDEALADFDRALERAPDNSWTLASKGETLRVAGKLAEAEEVLRRALAVSNGYAFAEASLGYTLLDQNRDREALSFFEKAVEHQPNDVWSLEGCAQALQRLDEVQKGLAVTRKLLDLGPETAWTRGVVGILFYMVEDYEAACRELERSRALDDNIDWVQNGLAWCSVWLWRATGRPTDETLLEKAAAAADKAIALAPGDLSCRTALAESLWEAKGRRDDAERELRRVLEDARTAKLDYYQTIDSGWAAYRLATARMGTEEARPLLAESERLTVEALALKADKAASSDAIAARFHLALVMLSTDRFALALREYGVALSLADEHHEPGVYKGLVGRATWRLAQALQETDHLAASSHAQKALLNLQANYPTRGRH